MNSLQGGDGVRLPLFFALDNPCYKNFLDGLLLNAVSSKN